MTNRLRLSPRHRRLLEALLEKHVPNVEVGPTSRVHGSAHEASDLDLVLRSPNLESLGPEYSELVQALEESNIPILVQAHDWAKLPKPSATNNPHPPRALAHAVTLPPHVILRRPPTKNSTTILVPAKAGTQHQCSNKHGASSCPRGCGDPSSPRPFPCPLDTLNAAFNHLQRHKPDDTPYNILNSPA